MITTATEIKHVINSFGELNEFGIDINLDDILVENFKQEIFSDINCAI